MRLYIKVVLFIILLLASSKQYAQHHSRLDIEIDPAGNTMKVVQQLTFYNQSNDTLSSIILNDWINAYSEKNSLLGRRFSDEYVRGFLLAKESERGGTSGLSIIDADNTAIPWSRPEGQNDLIEVKLAKKLGPYEKVSMQLTYTVRVPSDAFTKYGHDTHGQMTLKNWYLTPARFENHQFVHYSNANLDDIANGISDFDLVVRLPATSALFTDLNVSSSVAIENTASYFLSGKSRLDFSLFVAPKTEFYSYKNASVDVVTNLKDTRLTDIQKAIVVDRVVNYVEEQIGKYPNAKISVSQVDYERNPFYGLNQLPRFIAPFSDEFLYELKFLKTYLNNYLKTTLNLDNRKDSWIIDGIQVYVMMKYIEEHHPEITMMGSLSRFKILKSYNFINLHFNEQYSYYYMLMARENLDQPLGMSKVDLIRFNEKIAGKYRAGLSLKYLDNYVDKDIVPNSIKEFYGLNKISQTSREVFETLLKKNSKKDIDWFFNTIVDSRDLVDYKFSDYSKTNDSITFTIKNKTGTTVPIPVYGLKNDKVIFKEWYPNIKTDSTFTVPRQGADKIVLNYKNEVPEYNLRNNWKSLKDFHPNNRPYKFVFFSDLEDPYYNQIFYIPQFVFNLYDGLATGLSFHNKSLLDKPVSIDFTPTYSPKTQTLIGDFSVAVSQNIRKDRLYNVRYSLLGSAYHYAPEALYSKIVPAVTLKWRDTDFRSNKKEFLNIREVIVNREPSDLAIIKEEDYSIFNVRYSNFASEITKYFNIYGDFQLGSKFGKIAGEIQYRRLYENNRQINVRFFAGTFLYRNTDSEFYSFGLDRPTDYLFDYGLLGRSEATGIYSQQYVMAEGGFKSKLEKRFANRWMATVNASFNIWNWIEVYGDVGLIKNQDVSTTFVYDDGIRLNLVPDYFELYFPVSSSNGWEIAKPKYGEKIRFVITLSPKTLINLFKRKWY